MDQAKVIAQLRAVLSRALEPESHQSVSQWADQNRVLASIDSAEPGQWRTSRTPYLKEVMDCLSPHHPAEIVIMQAGRQIGKTSVGLNWIGFVMTQAPGPIMCVYPTMDSAKKFSRQRLDSMIDHSIIFRGIVNPQGARRERGNTQTIKEFPGGVLILTGANSPTGLVSMPVRYLLLDEIDAYPEDVDSKGDPVDIACRTTEAFSKKNKIFKCSTPSIEGFSRIGKAFSESDQRYYYVPCIECGHMDVMNWKRIVWPTGKPELAALRCDECGAVMPHEHKTFLLQHGEWRPTAEPKNKNSVGFHLSGTYSPWRTWGEIASEYIRVHKDPPRLQVFVNSYLAETWQDQAGERIDPDPLMARRERYIDVVPDGVGVLTAGIDVQEDRMEMQVIGWGDGHESWVVDYKILWSPPIERKSWIDLERLLESRYKHAKLGEIPISAACIDTGGLHTQMAYDFVRPRLAKKFWGIKGRGGPGVPIWPKRASRVDAKHGKVTMFNVGVDSAKDALYARLRIRDPGPGYIHFPMSLDLKYFEQLTGEHIVTRIVRGRAVRAWQPKTPDQPLEALDSFVYAMAALHGLSAQGLKMDTIRTTMNAKTVPIDDFASTSKIGWIGNTGDNWI
jgi:phage terminase large subunit GpA-like protein